MRYFDSMKLVGVTLFFFALTDVGCTSDKETTYQRHPSALIIDVFGGGFARSPTAFFSTDLGRLQVERRMKETGAGPEFRLNEKLIVRICGIVSSENEADGQHGTVFLLLFFDDRGLMGSSKMHKAKLSKIMGLLPKDETASVKFMYDNAN